MSTLRKDLQGLTKGGLQIPYNEETRPQEQLPQKMVRGDNEEIRPQEQLPRKLVREENEETRPQERLPRKLDREENEETRPQERMPRKLDREENEETRPQEPSPRNADERVPDDDQKLPRKQSAQILGDIARPDVDQSLPTPGNEEDANYPSNMESERHPRKKD
jgi:hypothetical protein